ncbi:MAG: patatin-like phospholipase family protein [Alphaproteobacteria bacterium]
MKEQKTVVVLFTYGGGMRGLIPAHIMAKIEEKTGLRMADMVDIFAGPSTGAILNAALNVPHEQDPARPRFRARHMVRFYEREGIHIFPPDRFRDFRGFVHDFNNRTMKIGQLRRLMQHGHYNPAHLSKCLRDLYGKRKLSETLKSLIIPVYNIDGAQLELIEEAGETSDTPVHTQNNFMDNGGHAVWLKHIRQRRNRRKTPDVLLHDAILASTAAPTYFPCHHFKAEYSDNGRVKEYSGIDGSIFDNPCISYHGAIRQHLDAGTRVIMILLGTGYTLRSFKREDWNSYGGLGVVDPVNDLPLINILFHAPESALIESFRQELGDDLFVFNKSLVAEAGKPDAVNMAIDDASERNLKSLQRLSETILEEQNRDFERLCHILVQNRDRAQKTQNSALKGLQGLIGRLSTR